ADVSGAQCDRARDRDPQGLLAVIAEIFMSEQPPCRSFVEQREERPEERRCTTAARALFEQQREDRSDQDVSASRVLEVGRDEAEVPTGRDLRDLLPVVHYRPELCFVPAALRSD